MDSSSAEQQAQLLTFIRRNCSALLARALQASSMASSKEPQYIPSSIRSTGAGTGTGYRDSLPSEYLDLFRETTAPFETTQPNITSSASYPSVNPFSKMPFELPDASLSPEGDLVVGGDPESAIYPQPHQHIILSHSESARNALIYIAVILAIYLVAVAFIAVQYYQKYQTLDPLTSFILRRSSRRKKDARKHGRKQRRRYSSSGAGNSGFEAIRSITSSSPTSCRNGSSSNGLIGESQCAPSCSGVRFDQLATVFSENGTTTTTLESNRSEQVNIQINIETVDDDELEEEDNVEEDYYEDDEEGDEEAPEEDEEEEDRFEEDGEMAVFADPEKGDTQPRAKTKRPGLRSLFSRHFCTSHDKAIPGTAQTDTTNQNGKVLTRSSSLQATDQPSVPHNPETDSWRPADLDSLKFKRSSIAGFTVAAGTGPLGLFKAHPRHYEETHL